MAPPGSPATTDRGSSTGVLLQLCTGYFAFYVLTGVLVKYFLKSGDGHPGMGGIEFLVNSTLGANVIVLIVILALRWVKLKSNRLVTLGPVKFPVELFYIVPSGVCTGIIIPTTTLMYTLPISVMVAMVIMRGSVIVISRIVDAIQIKQGILDKKVYWEENVGVVLAILAVATNVFASKKGDFEFLQNTAAMVILGSYVGAYAVRIYIMNFYKNTRAVGTPHDSRGFFACEQIAATATLAVFALLAFNATTWFGWTDDRVGQFREAATNLDITAILAGVPFGIVAFFSVFIFLFKGRTATFAGLVNRLTSLLAGVTVTLIVAVAYGGKDPTMRQWVSVGLIGIAVYFLTRAEKRRAKELVGAA